MNHKQLLKLYKANGGKTIVELKDPAGRTPYQTSRIEKYQMADGGGR